MLGVGSEGARRERVASGPPRLTGQADGSPPAAPHRDGRAGWRGGGGTGVVAQHRSRRGSGDIPRAGGRRGGAAGRTGGAGG